MLCKHYSCLVPEHFYHPERKPCPHEQSLPIPLPQPLAPDNLLHLYGSACSGSGITHYVALLCVTSFTRHDVFEFHPYVVWVSALSLFMAE